MSTVEALAASLTRKGIITDLPPMWRCGECPLIIVGNRPDDITEHQTEHQEAEK